MQDTNGWRIRRPESSREILSKSFPVTIPSDAYTKAIAALTVANGAQYLPENFQISISFENVLVILHAFSKGGVEENDYALAKKIDAALSSSAA